MKTLACVAVACLATGLMPGKSWGQDPKQIVFLAGDRSHGSGAHEFRAGSLLLARALNEQSGLPVKARVLGMDWVKDKSQLDDAEAVVIFCDASEAIQGEWAHLDALSKKGVGLMFMHYAVHPSKEMGDKYQRRWCGGCFETGFSVNPHWLAELEPMKDHQISRGVPEKFESFDEFYYNMRFLEDRDKVLDLATAIPTRERMRAYINLWNHYGAEGMGKPQTLMWGTQRPDGGRGVGFTGGHYHANWALDGFRTLVLNAIVWCAGMDVPEGGVQSEPVTEDQLNENLDAYDKPNPRLKLPDLDEVRGKQAPKPPYHREKKPGDEG